MRPITAVILLLCMVLVPGSVYALTGQPEHPQTGPGSSEPLVLCLNHRVSGTFGDVMMSQVYEWVHGGRLGINFTLTNKTNENIVIDWDKTPYFSHTAGEVSGDVKAPARGADRLGLYDVVTPGATFSKTLWPSLMAPNPWRVENRSVFLSASGEKGIERHEEIMLNISGEQRRCSI